MRWQVSAGGGFGVPPELLSTSPFALVGELLLTFGRFIAKVGIDC